VACLPTVVSLLVLEALFTQISGVSLALTWPCSLCLLRFFLYGSLCYKLSPFQAHWGGDTTSAFSGLRVYLQFTWKVGPPPSPVEFSSLRHSHKLSRSWLLGTHPRSHRSLSGLPGLFIYSPGKDSLPPLFGTQCTPPSFPHVFIVLIAYYSVSLFSLCGGRSVQGAMLLWPRVVCGSTVVPLSLPCLRLPKPSGHGQLAPQGPS
jgi:hypothetical protein